MNRQRAGIYQGPDGVDLIVEARAPLLGFPHSLSLLPEPLGPPPSPAGEEAVGGGGEAEAFSWGVSV